MKDSVNMVLVLFLGHVIVYDNIYFGCLIIMFCNSKSIYSNDCKEEFILIHFLK